MIYIANFAKICAYHCHHMVLSDGFLIHVHRVYIVSYYSLYDSNKIVEKNIKHVNSPLFKTFATHLSWIAWMTVATCVSIVNVTTIHNICYTLYVGNIDDSCVVVKRLRKDSECMRQTLMY